MKYLPMLLTIFVRVCFVEFNENFPNLEKLSDIYIFNFVKIYILNLVN